jgi:hypothetical protein
MAGLVIDNAFPRLISSRKHAAIDYIHAAANFAAGAFFFNRNRPASYAAFALGAGVLANALMTDYELGVFRRYPFRLHGIVDYGVASASASIPRLLDFEDTPEANFFYVQGAGETAIAGVSNYGDKSGARRWFKSGARGWFKRERRRGHEFLRAERAFRRIA